MLSRTHAAGSNGSKQFDCDHLTYPGSRSLSLLKTLAPGAVLLFIYSSAIFLLHPLPNLPFHDDWTYAWSVEHFLNTGELQVLDWSVHYPFVQILWGALFCLPFGFSFSALRVSTVVLAWVGAVALYGTLRELGRARSESLIATVVLVANPVFFVLGFSFMTDVPFVSFASVAFFFVTRGLSRKSPSQIYLGVHFCGVCPLHKTNSRCDTSQPTALFSFYAISQVVEISFTHQWNLFTVLPCPHFNCSNLWCDVRV